MTRFVRIMTDDGFRLFVSRRFLFLAMRVHASLGYRHRRPPERWNRCTRTAPALSRLPTQPSSGAKRLLPRLARPAQRRSPLPTPPGACRAACRCRPAERSPSAGCLLVLRKAPRRIPSIDHGDGFSTAANLTLIYRVVQSSPQTECIC